MEKQPSYYQTYLHPTAFWQKISEQFAQMITEFAKKYNITLQLWRPVNEGDKVEISERLNLTFNGELDLPMRSVPHLQNILKDTVEHSVVIQLLSFFALVPCAEAISIGDVYKTLKTYSTIV